MTNTKQNGGKKDLITPIIPSMPHLLLFNVNSGVQARHQVLSLTPASSRFSPFDPLPQRPHISLALALALPAAGLLLLCCLPSHWAPCLLSCPTRISSLKRSQRHLLGSDRVTPQLKTLSGLPSALRKESRPLDMAAPPPSPDSALSLHPPCTPAPPCPQTHTHMHTHTYTHTSACTHTGAPVFTLALETPAKLNHCRSRSYCAVPSFLLPRIPFRFRLIFPLASPFGFQKELPLEAFPKPQVWAKCPS